MISGSALDRRIPWVSDRQLAYWCEKGYVVPAASGSSARGPGNGRAFSDSEVRVLVVMARLVKAGLAAERAARIARAAVAAAGVSGEVTVELDAGLRLSIEGA